MASGLPLDIEARLKYLQWQESYTETRPYRISKFGRKTKNASENLHNLVFREGPCVETIEDIRGLPNDAFDLETTGFVYRKYPPFSFTNVKDFGQSSHIQNEFLPACETILRNEIKDVDQVFIFDWKIRKRKSAKERRTRNQSVLSFARQVHIDTLLTEDELGTKMMDRIASHLPEGVDLPPRVRLINMWRPLNGPVDDHPIAVCDGRTVDTSRLIESDMTRGSYTGTLIYPLNDPKNNYKWYYLSKQNVDDVLLFKSFDSKADSVQCESRKIKPPSLQVTEGEKENAETLIKEIISNLADVPHTTFQACHTPMMSRVSIEVRALVFTT